MIDGNLYAAMGWVDDYVQDLREAIRDSDQAGSAAKSYALAHLREVDIQLTYVRLALENK